MKSLSFRKDLIGLNAVKKQHRRFDGGRIF